MNIDYDHERNAHTLEGPRGALPILFPNEFPGAILDVGCGTGTWLRTCIELGAREVFGIDGVPIPHERLLFDPQFFRVWDLTTGLDLGRKFDAVLCLEVAEHLDEQFAPTLIDSLTHHSDYIVFSAASPGQPGQHHVTCRWPSYWQSLFNERGYACEDEVRWKIWDQTEIEPWYRQNMFVAKHKPQLAGLEPRIRSVVHPGIAKLQLDTLISSEHFPEYLGYLPLKQYPSAFARSIWSKGRRWVLRISAATDLRAAPHGSGPTEQKGDRLNDT